MRKPDTILDEIHATRRMIDDQTNGMTASERTDYFNQKAAAYARKYGFVVVAKPFGDENDDFAPHMKKTILDGKATPPSECLDSVGWDVS